MKRPNVIYGNPLQVADVIARDFQNPILKLLTALAKDIRREVTAIFAIPSANDAAMDENPSSQARIRFNSLMDKYDAKFADVAKKSTARMIDRVAKNSKAQMDLSLRDMIPDFSIKAESISDRLKEIMVASANEAAGLIKLIPQKYIQQVAGEVYRSLASGKGLQDLIPFLTEKYEGNWKWARNVALDQTRKSFSNMTAARAGAVGLDEYEWIHVGGSTHPRKLHLDMAGKHFKLSDPPVIGNMYGSEVRGKPGDLPFCRCKMRFVINFKERL
jgi:uncharacterized protein with gpF-like domain